MLFACQHAEKKYKNLLNYFMACAPHPKMPSRKWPAHAPEQAAVGQDDDKCNRCL